MLTQQAIRDQLPEHLRQFVAEQDYETRYTPRDQAIWRFVMRKLDDLLRGRAHPVYYEGLKKTGITIEHIPSVDEMNTCLSKLGWRAIVVDGFIPPQAFMELQSLRVLAIALDIRSIEHIDYTPAPDIIHEAAGHAPIIADEEYSDYLQRFGEIGMRALYNQWDLDVYEAVRRLSIIKENPDADCREIKRRETELSQLIQNPVDPSELALLTRLHWWTVEYGLVGSLDNAHIFGAGLLSSIQESQTCLTDEVRKYPLTVEAIGTSYDITCSQPGLFVTKSCRHLTQVLEEYAETMCFRRGGSGSIRQAILSKVVTTCEYSSGLQVSGIFNHLSCNAIGAAIYLGTQGPTQLACSDQELDGHGIGTHAAGFGSPVGRICNLMKPLEDASEYELQSLGIVRNEKVCLEFLSGIKVEGVLNSILKQTGKLILFSFSDCRVTGASGQCLFEPGWGQYDMAVGERITSVFAGSADRAHFDTYPPRSVAKVKPVAHSEADEEEFNLFRRTRKMRQTSGKSATDQALLLLAEDAINHCPDAWLLHLEILELDPGALLTKLRRQIKKKM